MDILENGTEGGNDRHKNDCRKMATIEEKRIDTHCINYTTPTT